MPHITVNGVTLAYEIFGDGSPIVLTPGAWFPRDNWVYLNAGCLAADHTILLWDRRNCGASDVRLEEAPSELHLWTDDLHHLLHSLDLAPAYLAGASKGTVFSLLMAHRYPDDVRGLILTDPPTDDVDLLRPFADARYYDLASVATTHGMTAALAHSTEAWTRIITGTASADGFEWFTKWMAESSVANARNRERFLTLDPYHFAALLKRKWRAVRMSDGSPMRSLDRSTSLRWLLLGLIRCIHDIRPKSCSGYYHRPNGSSLPTTIRTRHWHSLQHQMHKPQRKPS